MYMNVQNRMFIKTIVYQNCYIYIQREEVSSVSVYVFAVFVMHKWIWEMESSFRKCYKCISSKHVLLVLQWPRYFCL